MKNNNKVFDSVDEIKNTFGEYFDAIGKKSFKQFYFDWHIDAMLEPFADLAKYFCDNFENPKESFSGFIKTFKKNVETYNTHTPENSSLKVKEYSVTKDGQLSQIIDGVETFSFHFRQFLYSFADSKDHDREFSNWPIKVNMPHTHTHGLYVSTSILEFMEKNFKSIVDSENKTKKSQFLVDAYVRNNIAKEYKYTKDYNFNKRVEVISKMCSSREKLSKSYDEAANSRMVDKKVIDTFQVETGSPTKFGKYRPNGFELEFYYPEKIGNYDNFINHLKEHNNWTKLHTSNKDSSVYEDKESAGVIMRDESLSRYNGLVPVEFASRIMASKEDEEYCTRLFDAFDSGYVNVHCSLHQHVSATDMDLNGYKRLVKRMMKNEEEIVSSFAAPERRDGRLLYATYISHNLSSNSKRDYPMLCVMVDMCDDKKELIEMTCFGRKYKTLNLVPKNTVEFRFMNAHFNKDFAKAFMQFNRDMVNSAANNEGKHINRALLNKYNWQHNVETDNNRTIYKPLSYYYQCKYDEYRPKKTISKQAIRGEQEYSGLVLKALTETGKLSVGNTAFARKMRENYAEI